MEIKQSKIVEIKDLDKTLKFKIVLFDAMTGLEFIDKFVALQNQNSGNLSIKPFLSDLLPLAYLLGEDGGVVNQLSLDTAGVLFRSPVSIIELAIEILEMQQVFLNYSPRFHQLTKPLSNLFHAKVSE